MKQKAEKIGMDMTKGSILQILLRFAAPLLLSNLIQQLYNSVDMLIVGRVAGNNGTVGVSTGGEIAAFITFVAISFGTAGQIYTSQLIGAGRREQIKAMSGTFFTFTLVIAAFFTAISIVFCRWFLKWLNCPLDAYEEAAGYMKIIGFGLPFVFLYNALCGIMRGLGESRWPLVFVFISAAVNFFLDLMLVVVIPMRAAGSAIATVSAQALAFVLALAFMYCRGREEFFSFHIKNYKIKKKYLKPLLRIGIPLTVQSTLIHFSQLICVSWVNDFGMLAATVNSIGNKANRVIGVVTNSINGAAGSVVGQNLGAGQYTRVKKTVYTSICLGMVIFLFEAAVVLIWPEQVYEFFTADSEVIALGVTYLHILLITFALTMIQGPYTSVITGSGNAKLNFFCGIIDGIVLRLGISYLLAYNMGFRVIGYWYGNALAHVGPVVIGVVYFYSGKWKTFRFLKEEV